MRPACGMWTSARATATSFVMPVSMMKVLFARWSAHICDVSAVAIRSALAEIVCRSAQINAGFGDTLGSD